MPKGMDNNTKYPAIIASPFAFISGEKRRTIGRIVCSIHRTGLIRNGHAFDALHRWQNCPVKIWVRVFAIGRVPERQMAL